MKKRKNGRGGRERRRMWKRDGERKKMTFICDKKEKKRRKIYIIESGIEKVRRRKNDKGERKTCEVLCLPISY